MNAALPSEYINSKIYILRDHKVMLDFDLAEMYGIETRVFNQSVARNSERFPDDFRFQLTKEEFQNLTSHIVTSSWGGTRKPPYAFTEQGVAMLSGVLRSERAIQVNIEIMRAFVKMRHFLLSHEDLERRLDHLESKFEGEFEKIFEALRTLTAEEIQQTNPIGYINFEKKKHEKE